MTRALWFAVSAILLGALTTACESGNEHAPGTHKAKSGKGGGITYQPLDGGTYTWPNGVTMTLNIEKIEPWGDFSDYCGDGSCGVSHPDDLRVLIGYDVSVPEDAAEPLDGDLYCPGELETVNGSTGDLVIGVAGDYASELGTVLPGATKHGVSELSIDKSLIGQEFFLASTCGEPNGDKTAYFRGTIGAAPEGGLTTATPSASE